jgi:16S rRNA G966 N2-methylase RsmD
LNKRYSTRNLSDEDFASILPKLAEELVNFDYSISYTDEELKKDWNRLLNYSSQDNFINATDRVGLKILEHFMNNVWETSDAKGRSFKTLWKKDVLEKVLQWNRKCHSTPYLSEIRRGVYFCTGLPKTTMYRPNIMKLICLKYQPKKVLDPCIGWGGRMIGSVARGFTHYYGFEPNTKTFQNLEKIVDFLGIQNKVNLFNEGSENIKNKNLSDIDMVLTSPPYFDLEVYTDENTQSVSKYKTYQDWLEGWLFNVMKQSFDVMSSDGVSCWNVADFNGNKFVDDVTNFHKKNGFTKIDEFHVINSKRPVRRKNKENIAGKDTTMIFKKI